MSDDDKKGSAQFDAALPLPFDSKHAHAKIDHTKADKTAADLIRKKVEAAYGAEQAEGEEAANIDRSAEKTQHTKHQKFIYELTSSGKPMHEIQTAWQEYYAGLPEDEQHEVWQEFNNAQGHIAGLGGESTPPHHSHKPLAKHTGPIHRSLAKAANRKPAAKKRKPSPFRSIVFGLVSGCVVIMIFMFSFFNERFIAPFIQPSRNVANTPIISGAPISVEPEVIIPKINVEIPVVYDVNTINESDIDAALTQGVVHYADTAVPGQDGNVVIVGHSSNNIFNPGKYKFAFVLLSRLENGDTFYLQKDGKRYTYQVYKKEIVKPADVSVLATQEQPATASLITCDPPGTSTNRLVVIGTQIDPNVSANASQTATNKLATSTSQIPGNAPSLWSRLVKWFSE